MDLATMLGFGAFLLIMFIITWVVIGVSSTNDYSPSIRDYSDEFRMKSFNESVLESKVCSLEFENARLRNELRLASCVCKCHIKPRDEKKIATFLENATKSLDEVKKEFEIK